MISSEMSFNDLSFHKADTLSRNTPLIQSLSINNYNYYLSFSFQNLYEKKDQLKFFHFSSTADIRRNMQ